MNKSLYRLIKPYQSDKVYESSSIMHGAGKCYKEIIKSNSNTPEFSIMEINSNQIYDFKVSPSPKMEFRSNNNLEPNRVSDELLLNQQNFNQQNFNPQNFNQLNQQNFNQLNQQKGGTNVDINDLKKIISELTSRIEKLELVSKIKNI